MNIQYKATNMDMTDSIRDYIEEKVGGLDKFIESNAHVEISRDKHHRTGAVFRVEVNLTMGGKLIRADHTSEDIYASVDLVIPKLKEQISKFKDKKQTLTRRGARSAKRKN